MYMHLLILHLDFRPRIAIHTGNEPLHGQRIDRVILHDIKLIYFIKL